MRGEPFGAKAPPGGAGGLGSRAGGGRPPVWSTAVMGVSALDFHCLSGPLVLDRSPTVSATNLPQVVSRCLTGEERRHYRRRRAGARTWHRGRHCQCRSGQFARSLGRWAASVPITLVRKTLRPLTAGRHAMGRRTPDIGPTAGGRQRPIPRRCCHKARAYEPQGASACSTTTFGWRR